MFIFVMLLIGNTLTRTALPNGNILMVESDNMLILYDFFSGMAFALYRSKKCLMGAQITGY